MKIIRLRARLFISVALAATLAAVPAPAETVVKTISYHGWENSLLLSNGKIEVIVVPAIGRVMQARFAAEEDGPFWENRALDGRKPDPASSDWGNFGGDKTWPAPQSDWPSVTPRGWPPPPAFDSMPARAEIVGDTVVMTTAVDKDYGIRAERRIRLLPDQAGFTITTTYRKVEGPPRRAGVWVITQLKDPAGVYIQIPANTIFPSGYDSQSDKPPLGLAVANGTVSLRRGSKDPGKIGTDANGILWIGPRWDLLVESPRQPGQTYPDGGSSAEVYTNPDTAPYVELELLGPLRELKPGDAIESKSTYRLLRRENPGPAAEARRVFGTK
jgi:hypothetical protein